MTESIDLLALAMQYVCARGAACAEIETRKLRGSVAAHDGDRVQKLQRRVSARLTSLQHLLAREFGDPSERGQGLHVAIPRGDIVQFAIWRVGERTLYLAVAHDRRESPWIILLGVSA